MKEKRSVVENQIRSYIQNNYRGGRVGISKLAKFCNLREGQLMPVLKAMEANGYLQIFKRYYCPESHFLHDAPGDFYCDECSIDYHPDQISIVIQIKPLPDRYSSETSQK